MFKCVFCLFLILPVRPFAEEPVIIELEQPLEVIVEEDKNQPLKVTYSPKQSFAVSLYLQNSDYGMSTSTFVGTRLKEINLSEGRRMDGKSS